jgi:preprotein translocase subunit SecA
VLNEVKRQLLLSAITELWVEYLTKVEGLRVSIGLEAYAQRDPLVQYKGQASELLTTAVRRPRRSSKRLCISARHGDSPDRDFEAVVGDEIAESEQEKPAA